MHGRVSSSVGLGFERLRAKDDANSEKDSPAFGNLFVSGARLLRRPDNRRATMQYALIRYGVKEQSVAENRARVEKVFEELHRAAPEGFRYLVLQLEDGEFVHFVGNEAEANPLAQLPAFKAFTGNHEERRSTPISRKSARIVDDYRMIASGKPEQRHG
jgi:hypothetical protein